MFVVLNKTDMKASELRIGNYVHHNERNYLSSYLDSYLTVCELTEKSITTFYHSCHGGIQVVRNKKDYQPIPITEEWLLRLGFEEDGIGWYFLQIEDHVTKLGYCYNVISKIFEINEMEINGIQYVHQLQNLYFALTSKDLTIKEAAK